MAATRVEDRRGMMTKTFLIAPGTLLVAAAISAQVQPPPAPWRGAGPTPCVGSDGGIYKCVPTPPTTAIRAGRLFDSRTGTMLTNQVVVLSGGRIADVGPAAQVKVPADAQVIDL